MPVPPACLDIIPDALKLCKQCNDWKQPAAKPVGRLSLSPRFNYLVYGDLVSSEYSLKCQCKSNSETVSIEIFLSP